MCDALWSVPCVPSIHPSPQIECNSRKSETSSGLFPRLCLQTMGQPDIKDMRNCVALKQLHDGSMGKGRADCFSNTSQGSAGRHPPNTQGHARYSLESQRRGERRREGERGGRGVGSERAAAASGPSRTRGHRAGPGLQVPQMMASENLNKGGRRRRAAAAESCGGGFPGSAAATRALGDASSPFPPPPRQRRGPAGEGKGKL